MACSLHGRADSGQWTVDEGGESRGGSGKEAEAARAFPFGQAEVERILRTEAPYLAHWTL